MWAHGIIPCSPNMVNVRVCSKLKTSRKSVVFITKFGKNFRYFADVFNITIIPLAVFGYEMIIAISALRFRWLSNAHKWNLHVINIDISYTSEHEYDWPHDSGDGAILIERLCFVFPANGGKNCWNETNEKTSSHYYSALQLWRSRLLTQNQKSVKK